MKNKENEIGNKSTANDRSEEDRCLFQVNMNAQLFLKYLPHPTSPPSLSVCLQSQPDLVTDCCSNQPPLPRCLSLALSLSLSLSDSILLA